MAEFVERELEQLLPAFEQLKVTQLMSADELNDFISQCRAFEYKCAKRTKRANDFLSYATYMADQIDAVMERRRQLKFMHRYDQIERPLKRKCAFIHRICAHRCKKLVYHRHEIAFLRRANMFKQCSQAYTRLLNVHGNLANNHEEAARFEFFDNNHSADSARDILQKALRKFPTEIRLWLTYFEIELRFVEFLYKRRQFFLQQNTNNNISKNKKKRLKKGKKVQQNDDDDGQQQTEGTAAAEEFKQFNDDDGAAAACGDEDDDEVLGLKLVHIVYEMAMKNVVGTAEKTKLLHDFLRVARAVDGAVVAVACAAFGGNLVQKLTDHLHALGEQTEEEEKEEGADDQQQQQQQLIPDDELFAVDTEGDGTAIFDDDDEQHDEDGNSAAAGGGGVGAVQQRHSFVAANGGREEDEKLEQYSGSCSSNNNNNGMVNNNKKVRSSVLDGFDPDDPELKLLLSKATLTDDYDRRPIDDVLHVSARQQKKRRLAERAATAGPSWHQMPATELTEERRRDLEVVQMRDALDPAQHYRKPDREVLPKYFQIGQIIESKADFYAGRVPKRQRKRTMVEELMADTELLARNKRRFTAIVQRREAATMTGTRGAFQRRGPPSKWSKRKRQQRR